MSRRRWQWIGVACFLPLLFIAFKYRPLSHESMKQRACLAASHGDLPTLKRLLSQGLSPSTRVQRDDAWLLKMALGERDYYKLGEPLTMVAYENGHPAVTRYLLDHGADVNNVESAGTTLLFLAAVHNDLSFVKELLARGADPYSCWKDGSIPYSADPRIQALLKDAKDHCSDRGLPCKRHGGHPTPGSS